LTHPARDAFELVLEHVERAKAELVAATPSPRGVPPRSLAEALIDFEHALGSAFDAMPAWRTDDTAETWRSCAEAIERSLAEAERLRIGAPALDYEGLVAVLADLIAPLEAFDGAERSVR
jgi:hypothetical protein